jgi:hypothetical protein
MYTVYFGPKGCGDRAGSYAAQLLSKRFASVSEALLWAHVAAGRGSAVLRLQGDDGTDLNRDDLACAFRLLAVPSGPFSPASEDK